MKTIIKKIADNYWLILFLLFIGFYIYDDHYHYRRAWLEGPDYGLKRGAVVMVRWPVNHWHW